MNPFIKNGLDRGEKAFHIVAQEERSRYILDLEAYGIDVVAAEQRGQFDLRTWDETYFLRDRFDPDEMIALVSRAMSHSRLQGYPLFRIVAHMGWALLERPGVDQVIEYEARFNNIMPEGTQDVVLCLYDTTIFGGDIIMDVLRTHPVVLSDTGIHRNPFYMPPEEFLKELRERQRRAAEA